jgi:hypothetical protein
MCWFLGVEEFKCGPSVFLVTNKCACSLPSCFPSTRRTLTAVLCILCSCSADMKLKLFVFCGYFLVLQVLTLGISIISGTGDVTVDDTANITWESVYTITRS